MSINNYTHQRTLFYNTVQNITATTFISSVANINYIQVDYTQTLQLCARVSPLRRLVGTGWGASAKTLRTAALSLVYSTAEYCAPVWCRSVHIRLKDSVLTLSWAGYLYYLFWAGGGANLPPLSNSLLERARDLIFCTLIAPHQNF